MSFLAAATAVALSPGAALALTRRFRERLRHGRFAAIDTNHDGTLDLAEVQHAAKALFNRLDTDHKGTLSWRQLRRRLSAAQFAGAADKNGRLTKEEYLAVVERRFKAADADHDGTLTPAEFLSRAGWALQRLLYFPRSTTP
jgi:Ca2+-binding EF-hand superfamily protein